MKHIISIVVGILACSFIHICGFSWSDWKIYFWTIMIIAFTELIIATINES